MAAPSWAEPLFHDIAVPRGPGSASLARVQDVIVQRLELLGFTVEQQRFATDARRLGAAMAAGAGLGWVAIGVVPLLLLPLSAWLAPLIGLPALALVGLVAVGIAEGRIPFNARAVRGTNLVARRGTPRLWLVAHADSKSQPASLLLRVVGAAAAFAGTAGLVVLLVIRLFGQIPLWAVAPVAALAVLGGGILSLGMVGDASPGAVDNATGVIAALVAAAALGGRDDVGVLITDAEEYGLEGARAWVAAERPHGAAFVNFDGVDDCGVYRVMRHGARGAVGWVTPVTIADQVTMALQERGHAATAAALPFGVLVDGIALAGAGMAGVTVSRGDAGTLAVVHRPADEARRVDVAAAVEAGEATAVGVARLLG
jgi:acetylornithine deacetylase/succinyl-diaminopimelate desuccinylase-like protein